MRNAGHFADRHSCRDTRRDMKSARRLLSLTEVACRDRGICFIIVAIVLGGVPRPNDRRIHDLISAVGRYHEFGVSKLDPDLVIWHYVRETHRKDVWPSLFQQRRTLTFLLCL